MEKNAGTSIQIFARIGTDAEIVQIIDVNSTTQKNVISFTQGNAIITDVDIYIHL